MIYSNTHFVTFKDLTMILSNVADNRSWKSHHNEVDIPVVAEVVGAFETDEHSPYQPPAPPGEVFTTTVINVFEFSV